jgi:chemotaxis protein methyltransferase CheR
MCLPDATFQFLRQFVLDHSAISIESDKQYLIEARLAPIVCGHDMTSLEALSQRLRSEPFGPLHREVVDAITTNETSFFRDRHPFETLRTLIPRVARERPDGHRLRIWCAGCSSGQEAYSLAMLLLEQFPELARGSVELLGTDISGRMIRRARDGRYSQLEINRGLPAPLLVRYFEQEPGGVWRIKSHVRAMVRFAEHNLVGDRPPPGHWDIVFLRNVLIYFDVDMKRSILGRVRRALNSPGYLFLGGAETTINLDDAFERVVLGQSACYRVPVKGGAVLGSTREALSPASSQKVVSG